MILKKKKSDKNEANINDVYMERILSNLKETYSNKSNDESKCKGDITKSPNYESIEFQVSQLSSIKGYPEENAKAVKNLFNTLHKPIFKKMTEEYLAKPDEKNIVFAASFAVGYRLLIGELARVIASSEATDEGFVYNKNKVKAEHDFMPMIRAYTDDIEKKINKILTQERKSAPVQEAATLRGIGVLADMVVSSVEAVFGTMSKLFKGATALNPISLISAMLSRSYDKKVETYMKISKEYEAAKKAYDEYKQLPEAKRKKRIEHRYIKMIEKYNIKMSHLKAKIDDFDLRSKRDDDDIKKESKNKKAESKSSTSTSSSNNDDKKDDNLPTSSSTVDTTSNTSSGDDFDF